MTRHAPRCLNDLLYRESCPIPQVADQLVLRLQRMQCQNVRICQVRHVNIIANAGAIRCVVVFPKDGDTLAASQGNVQNQWNNMAFRLVHFPAARQRSGYVKVPQGRVP